MRFLAIIPLCLTLCGCFTLSKVSVTTKGERSFKTAFEQGNNGYGVSVTGEFTRDKEGK